MILTSISTRAWLPFAALAVIDCCGNLAIALSAHTERARLLSVVESVFGGFDAYRLCLEHDVPLIIRDVESHSGVQGKHSRRARLGRQFLNFVFFNCGVLYIAERRRGPATFGVTYPVPPSRRAC